MLKTDLPAALRALQKMALPVVMGTTALSAQALPTINLTGATYNDVTATTEGTISNALGSVTFTNQKFQPTGTGVFNPFLRLDVKGNVRDEQGYNTSATISEGSGNNYTTRKVLDNMAPVNWTHDVLISDLNLVTVGNGRNKKQFYEFKLDINEPGNANSLLSLDGLKLWSTSTPSQSSEGLDGRGDWAGPTNSTLLWDMDYGATNFATSDPSDPKDKSVLLDAALDRGPGSGASDMVMMVDKAVIDKAAAGQNYLVLWSRFGLEQAANTGLTTADAGFEEWSYSLKQGSTTVPNDPGSGVPLPGTAALALLALGMLVSQQRRGRGQQSVLA